MRRRYLIPGVLALCALPAAGWTGIITPIFSENFDELTPMLGATSVGGFHTINGTNVDILGGSLFGNLCAPAVPGNCIDLNGTGGNPQGVLQSNTAFTLVPGVDYHLEFVLLGSQRGNTTSVTVTFGPLCCGTLTVASGDVSTYFPIGISGITVSAPTTTYLTFAADQGGDVGPILERVIVDSFTPTATPEPATLGLLALGLAGVGFARRKRK